MSGSGGRLATGRRVSQVVLAPEADAPGAAREFAVETLRQWGVPHWGEPVELVVSELVTNAVRHAGTMATLRLEPADNGLVIAVDDASTVAPRLLPTGTRSATGGLGLAIVNRLAEAWGSTERDGGKTVWARLRLADGADGEDGADNADTAYAEDIQDTHATRDPESAPEAPREVSLELPWDKDMVGMLRSVVGHLAVRAGFERRDLEDLRLAVDEIFALLYGQGPGVAGTAISCRFSVGPGRVALAVEAPVAARRPPDVDDFGWHLLQALVDHLQWWAGDRACGVRAEKRKGAGP